MQAFLQKIEATLIGNESCIDAINVSLAIQKVAFACCSTPPVGEALVTAKRLLDNIVGMCLNLQGTFKMDGLTVAIGALAKLSQANSKVLPSANSEEALDIQASPHPHPFPVHRLVI